MAAEAVRPRQTMAGSLWCGRPCLGWEVGGTGSQPGEHIPSGTPVDPRLTMDVMEGAGWQHERCELFASGEDARNLDGIRERGGGRVEDGLPGGHDRPTHLRPRAAPTAPRFP